MGIFCHLHSWAQFPSKHIYHSTKIRSHRKIHKLQKHFEKPFDVVIKKLYTDNGGEYVALSGYLRQNGIVWESTAPYTPQQNGVSEKTNRTLMNMVRAMLNESSVPLEFWAEAVITVSSEHYRAKKSGHDNSD